MRIAVVGAGSAGMSMAKQILDANEKGANVAFTVFERRTEVGGIWQYDACVPDGFVAWETDDGTLSSKRTSDYQRARMAWNGNRPPGPMFEGLRTNIPSDLMSFRDNLIAQHEVDLFPARHTVQAYLEEYATKYALRPHIRFNTNVTRVVKDTHTDGWIVESAVDGGETSTKENYTHIVLAHGRCNTPSLPNVEGLETFTGRIMHSAWYRDPTLLWRDGESRTVVVVGNASSGMDIARELSGYITRTLPCGLTQEEWEEQCKASPINVISSWHSTEKPPPMDYDPRDESAPWWCKRIKVVERISHIEGSTLFLADGSRLDDVPLLLFATGYAFDCPFLDQSVGSLQRFPLLPPCHTNAQRKGSPASTLFNLDDWLIMHDHDETLAILGMPVTVVPFPFSEVQSFYVIRRWLKQADKLPLLDRTIPVNDSTRWSSRRREGDVDKVKGYDHDKYDNVILRPMSHVFGKPSDHAYLDALLRFVHLPDDERIGKSVPWAHLYKSDGRGNGTPRGPEALYVTSPWRNERRQNSRALRRETLGY